VQPGKGWGQRVSATAPAADWNYAADAFKLRIPDRYIKFRDTTYGPVDSLNPIYKWARGQKFIPIALERQKATTNSAVIAPILPGRYGVIGSAGTQYPLLPTCFTTTLGRQDSGQKNTSDTNHAKVFLKNTRRIELVPNPNPNIPQVVVASNGGDPKDEGRSGVTPTPDPATLEIGRDNELINNQGTVENITDQNNDGLPDNDSDNDGIPDNGFYRSAVAIPVEGMSVSEPTWGWAPREEQAADDEYQLAQSNKQPSWPPPTRTVYPFNPLGAEGEGAYFSPAQPNNVYSYDTPFDTAPELIRTGTTPNYRTVHLQRLANPLLPWNPPPGKFKDAAGNDLHRANLPINLYRTVDSSTVNLTAFNGPSEEEHRIKPPGLYADLRKSRPWLPGSTEIQDYLQHVKDGTQAWYLRSTERGFWARLNMAGQAVNPKTSPPQRVLWAQEPAMIEFRKAAGSFEILDLLPGRNMTMRTEEVPLDVQTNLKVSNNNHVNMVLEHSLGFGNETFGTLYDAQAAQSPQPPSLNAIGVPRPGRYVWDSGFTSQINSTNPWFAWNNRPFVSAEEILNVPAASTATMLRYYSTISRTTTNPYDGTGLVDPSQPAAAANLKDTAVPLSRLGGYLSPFGHLLNFVATANFAADVVRETNGVPELDMDPNFKQVQPYCAPHFYRILEYVHVPSRYVGTDTLLSGGVQRRSCHAGCSRI
jgi:hypothetical protein